MGERGTPRSVLKPPAESKLLDAWKLGTKQKLMRRIISEVCWYVAYLMLISIVACGNRDPKAYYVTKTMNDVFAARLSKDDVSKCFCCILVMGCYWHVYDVIRPLGGQT